MITKTVINNGNQVITSNNGKITVDQTAGQITIRDGLRKVVEINSDGFTYYNSAGNKTASAGENGFRYYDKFGTERISMGQDNDGMQQIIVDDASGRASILIGQDPTDGKPILLVGKEGVDVIDAS